MARFSDSSDKQKTNTGVYNLIMIHSVGTGNIFTDSSWQSSMKHTDLPLLFHKNSIALTFWPPRPGGCHGDTELSLAKKPQPLSSSSFFPGSSFQPPVNTLHTNYLSSVEAILQIPAIVVHAFKSPEISAGDVCNVCESWRPPSALPCVLLTGVVIITNRQMCEGLGGRRRVGCHNDAVR